jgi:membrane protein required for beta-lactamase induction
MFALVVIMTMFAAMTFDPRLSWDREIQAMRKSKSMENKSGEAKVQKVKNWSPVWIFPIVTALIGAWILFYHYSHQGRK